MTHCSCFPSVGVCNHGSLRLQDGVTLREGRVEVCINGVWSTVCDNFWDVNDARVVCTQLGYDTSSKSHFNGLDPVK